MKKIERLIGYYSFSQRQFNHTIQWLYQIIFTVINPFIIIPAGHNFYFFRDNQFFASLENYCQVLEKRAWDNKQASGM